MNSPAPLVTRPIDGLVEQRGVLVPPEVKFRSLIVVGPPGSGKTTLVGQLRGWTEEGYLDLATRWWRSRQLTFRPRELHLGLPFRGHAESHAVFDPEWLADPTPLEPERIRLPPTKRWFFQADWYQRLAFDVQLIPAQEVYRARLARAEGGGHHVDIGVKLADVERQLAAYQAVALYLHQGGLQVHVRTAFGGPPLRIVGPAGPA